MLWYISFADYERFYGATIVKANDPHHALEVATALGLNPGGDAAIVAVPRPLYKSTGVTSMINRLVDEAEIRAQPFGAISYGEMPDDMYQQMKQMTTEINRQ